MKKKAEKRPFRQVKGLNIECDQYAIENNRRPFVFNFADQSGASVVTSGSVPANKAREYYAIMQRLRELGK